MLDKLFNKLLFTNSYGKRSVTLTMLIISFVVVITLFVCCHISSLQLKEFDSTGAGVIFGGLLATYVGRRYTSAKFEISAPTATNAPSQTVADQSVTE